MAGYNPHEDVPASPGDLLELSGAWKEWLIATGYPGAANDEPPLGFVVHEVSAGSVVEPRMTPIAAQPVIYRRPFSSADIHFLVPRAAAVLGLGSDDFSISYYGGYMPCQDIKSEPGEYIPPKAMFAIPKPAVPGADLRAYKLTEVGGFDLVLGTRHDRLIATRAYLTDEGDRDPRITRTECEVLAAVGQACMTVFSSERERKGHPSEGR